jgi:hypothetical protein
VATAQPQDYYATCEQLQAEIQANNAKVVQLANEQGMKVAQNVAAGVGGLFIWPLFFAMDFKGAADKEVTALQARQQYLATLASQRCAPPPPQQRRSAGRPVARAAPPPPPTAYAAPPAPPPPGQLPPSAYYQPPPKPEPPPQRDFGTPN